MELQAAPNQPRPFPDEFDATALDLGFPVDAHVIGEPVAVTQISGDALTRAGLRATCRRGEHVFELSLADVVFPPASAGAAVVARYRAWLGLPPAVGAALDDARPHKVDGGDIVVGRPLELVVLACKSSALRCRLPGSTREVTLRTAVRDEIPGALITVTPRKSWTHGRHPYLSGDVAAVRIDATVLGLVPLALHRDDRAAGRRPSYRMEAVYPRVDDLDGIEALLEVREYLAQRDYAAADELLQELAAADLRCLDAHVLLGERNRGLPTLALHHFELGVAIGALTVPDPLDGELPWAVTDNRPFLRCLHRRACSLLRLDRRAEAAATWARLLALDPADELGAQDALAAIAAGKTWRDLEPGG